jgi:hypothetical protein
VDSRVGFVRSFVVCVVQYGHTRPVVTRLLSTSVFDVAVGSQNVRSRRVSLVLAPICVGCLEGWDCGRGRRIRCSGGITFGKLLEVEVHGGGNSYE